MICVFDCETIPDIELIRKNFEVEGEDFEAIHQALQQYEAKAGTTFLPHPYHKVVAISAVFADDFGRFKKVGTFPGDDEKEIIESFLSYIDSKNPKLVSFNGRNFDIPMLLLRAMKYNLSCSAYFEQDNQMLNKSKWENYRSRYSESFHLDLMDVLSNFGAARGLKLDTLCQMAGIPGKFDVDGSQVLQLYYNNDLDKIQEYCESDVINTYLLFLKYELLKGGLSKEEYRDILYRMQEIFPKEKSYSEIFMNYMKKESHGSE
ncbi:MULTISPECIES: 3'-5' exonuclease [unclassified Nitratiruptor]|uniref:3'-5' exonuclease n=1 Tax=unclassified Nitratiruptor TaxID=2624044 RepID=UPI001915C6AD|nr:MULTISPECIES: 3'-5' exonuclease [unclassified Nitratiruptor]BCD60721.1 3'-5' exonuclease [Nitratiruptor sp. YY08-10]BCD64653.1 3'-5' exonuclease [Nitratiruptor sp. YY08-14]